MVCSCCQTGRCCNGATCSSKTSSECTTFGGTYTAGGDCSSLACIDGAGKGQCMVTDACVCAVAMEQGIRTTQSTCNCATLQSAGYTAGGCRWYYCETCNSSTGSCQWGCASVYQECCNGTCCPLSQTCVPATGTCVNKCSSGTTFCAGTGSAYTCCTSGQKCCGASGCLSPSTTAFTINVTQDAWVSTGVTLTAGTGATITATGTVQWSGAGSTATPDGVTSAACNCCDWASVSTAFCHMALLGRVGTSGTPFLVGSSYSGVPGAGLLYLRQNDVAVSDNSGSFTGTIVTDPCPGFTPASVGEPVVYAAGETPPATQGGPGAELKNLLRYAGIVASPTCSCNARAAQMDEWGEWESLKRTPEICGWLKEEAAKRDLWFFPPAGVALILAAISLSALKRPFRGNNQ